MITRIEKSANGLFWVLFKDDVARTVRAEVASYTDPPLESWEQDIGELCELIIKEREKHSKDIGDAIVDAIAHD